jgi:hypothetical protein
MMAYVEIILLCVSIAVLTAVSKEKRDEKKKEMGLRHDCFDALFGHQYLWHALGMEVLWTARVA